MPKKFDLAVKVGSYVNNEGEDKNKYENVGVIMENSEGNQYILLKKTFNPAGVPDENNRESILINIFEPKNKNNKGDF